MRWAAQVFHCVCRCDCARFYVKHFVSADGMVTSNVQNSKIKKLTKWTLYTRIYCNWLLVGLAALLHTTFIPERIELNEHEQITDWLHSPFLRKQLRSQWLRVSNRFFVAIVLLHRSSNLLSLHCGHIQMHHDLEWIRDWFMRAERVFCWTTKPLPCYRCCS